MRCLFIEKQMRVEELRLSVARRDIFKMKKEGNLWS